MQGGKWQMIWKRLFKPVVSLKVIRDVITDSLEGKENNEALESWRRSISECEMKIEERFSKVYYFGNNLQIFSAAKDDDIKIAHNTIKKIDESYDSIPIKKLQMEGKPKNYLILLILMQGKTVII